jgi:hypothetical protein
VSAAELAIEMMAMREFPATVIDATDMGTYAVELAVNGWEVGPLCQTEPIPGTTRCRTTGPHGKDPVGYLVRHGVYDFTTNVGKVINWWSRTPWNIGIRVPASMFVLDVDGPDRLPHPGKGLQALAQVEEQHGPLPPTLTQISGSGGLHLFFRRPPGKLSEAGLPDGLEYKDRGGYIVAAPSIHPDTGERYVWCDHPVAAPPRWLINMIVEKPARRITPARPRSSFHGRLSGSFSGSIADRFSASTSWADILTPHGWSCDAGDRDADGAVWLHPTHTSKCSATVKNGCLFVYSPNTPFDVTQSGNPKGYTKFRAYAVLNHAGDMSAAARAILKET